MKIQCSHNDKTYQVDLASPIDISIPLIPGEGVNCFYAPPFSVEPVVAGDFIGSTQKGGPVNFYNFHINPHGNGTHTECVGHISKEKYTINRCLKEFHFIAQLITVTPRKAANGDLVITREEMRSKMNGDTKALIVRTQPNGPEKKTAQYSGTNPMYVHHDAIQYIVDNGVHHLVIDLPSVDKEEDGGALTAHKAFWHYPDKTAEYRTITEMVYIDNIIPDDLYLLNIQIASFEMDASPSKITIYDLTEIP